MPGQCIIQMYHQITNDNNLKPLTFEELMELMLLGTTRSSSDRVEPVTPEDLTLEGFFRL